MTLLYRSPSVMPPSWYRSVTSLTSSFALSMRSPLFSGIIISSIQIEIPACVAYSNPRSLSSSRNSAVRRLPCLSKHTATRSIRSSASNSLLQNGTSAPKSSSMNMNSSGSIWLNIIRPGVVFIIVPLILYFMGVWRVSALKFRAIFTSSALPKTCPFSLPSSLSFVR